MYKGEHISWDILHQHTCHACQITLDISGGHNGFDGAPGNIALKYRSDQDIHREGSKIYWSQIIDLVSQ